jgi:hypothetical protein
VGGRLEGEGIKVKRVAAYVWESEGVTSGEVGVWS